MNRRGFLSAILAAAVAPAVVRAAALMPVRTLDSGIVLFDGSLGAYGNIKWKMFYRSIILNQHFLERLEAT